MVVRARGAEGVTTRVVDLIDRCWPVDLRPGFRGGDVASTRGPGGTMALGSSGSSGAGYISPPVSCRRRRPPPKVLGDRDRRTVAWIHVGDTPVLWCMPCVITSMLFSQARPSCRWCPGVPCGGAGRFWYSGLEDGALRLYRTCYVRDVWRSVHHVWWIRSRRRPNRERIRLGVLSRKGVPGPPP